GLSKAYDTLVRFQISWTPKVNEPLEDLALVIYGPDGKLVASSDGSQASEGINVTDRVPGVYTVLVCAFQNPPTGTAYQGSATAYTVVPGGFPRATGVPVPTYHQFTAPKKLSTSAGEPSIGSNWKTGRTLFTSNTDEYVVAFDDKRKTSTWTLVNDDVTDPSNKISLDPIGYTDSVTGRTFVSQLYLACSAAAYSDDDFATAPTVSQGCGSGVNGFDHQTFGGGPFPENVQKLPTSTYPHAVYYCAQGQGLALGGATCSRSDDGGLTFNPPVATWTDACSGIHGHVRVAPNDGTVYLPDGKCGDKQGVAVSRDGGQTWNVRTVPDSISGESDPSVDAGRDGTVYFGYSDGTGHPKIAVSRNRGTTWSPSVDLGAPFGVRNSEFAEVVAGDGDRAAMAFLGTTTPGSTQADSFGKSADGTEFTGAAWHLYVATTYDRGAHWTTVDATPHDPVQRGCIWNSGGSNPCRNLLDFNAITIDRTGRVMVGFADGCVGPDTEAGNDCVDSTSVKADKLVDHGAIVRQLSGLTLFRAFDPKGTRLPGSASAQGTRAGAVAGGRAAGGGLPATGGAPAVAGLGLLLLAAAWLVRKQQQTR
ncbi:MAG: sialidase family protein, partial [Mycobacteriales bacterium]